jgi:hypothetical protein
MSSLLAILLVVNSTRGHHYLFSYPPNPKRTSSHNRHSHGKSNDFTVGSSMATRIITPDTSTAEDNRRISNASKGNNNNNSSNNNTANSNANNNDSSNNNNSNNNNNNNSTTKNDDIFAGRDTIFNLDVSFLADALAPKLPLCDRKFQLSMDDLTFVGHPVSLSTLQHNKHDVNSEDHEQTSMDLSSPLSPIPPSQQQQQQQPSSPPPPPNSPPSLMSSHRSTENDIIKEENSSDDNQSESDTFTGSTSSIHMTLFHVVFVMTPPDLELNAQVETLYKNVILRYSSALRYEQLRCGYVQEEIEKVLGLKEEAFNKGKTY